MTHITCGLNQRHKNHNIVNSETVKAFAREFKQDKINLFCKFFASLSPKLACTLVFYFEWKFAEVESNHSIAVLLNLYLCHAFFFDLFIISVKSV